MLPLSHLLYYLEQTSAESISPTTVTTSGNVTEATVMDLQPFTNYDCYVTANTSVGEGPPSDIKTQRTEESGECVLIICTCMLFICMIIFCELHVYTYCYAPVFTQIFTCKL